MDLLLITVVSLFMLAAGDDEFVYTPGTGNTPEETLYTEKSQSSVVYASADQEEKGWTYLDRPRLHFSGLYKADVPTVNNFFDNYNVSNFSLINQLVKKPHYADFNPKGSGAFSFQNCLVTSVCSSDRSLPCTMDDPLVGIPLQSTTGHSTGKMAGIDVELEHNTPIIYGMTIGLDLRRSQTFVGAMEAAPTRNIWHNVWDVGTGPNTDQFSQADFQSIINATWNDKSYLLQRVSGSPILINIWTDLLKSPSLRLSIKFNLDHYQQNNESDPQFLYGRVTGTIGLAGPKTTKHFVRERVLQFVRYPGVQVNTAGRRATNVAPFKVGATETKSYVVFDFGNALSRSTFDGGWNTFVLGKTLRIVTRYSKELIGTVNFASSQCLNAGAGICEFLLSSIDLQSDYVDVYNDLSELLLREVEYYIRPLNHYIGVLNPGDPLTVIFFVNNFGKKLSGHSVYVEVQLASKHTPDDKKEKALKALQIVNGDKVHNSRSRLFISDEQGQITVNFSVSSPGNPRKIVDGEVYRVSYVPDVDNQGYTYLYFRVFDEFEVPESPQWSGKHGVGNIFKQYDYLYPVMRKFLVLSDYHSVIIPWNVHFLNLSMRLDVWNPGHMPVSRDLSRGKRETILKWLNNISRHDDARTKEDVKLEKLRQNLQTAIEVEHSTIPLYLYALYSIKPGTNVKAYETIQSVVIEEMVHMTLAANILNAIGGNPSFVHDQFIPIFPGPMAGGLHPELTLKLQPLTKDLLKDVFMAVEQPRRAPIEGETEVHNLTIGSFYRRIAKQLEQLDSEENIFIPDHSRQIDGTYFPNDARVKPFPVTDLNSALKAIKFIVTEGEGTNRTNPTDFNGTEMAHYYKFAEIYHGHELVKDGKKWTFTGPPIPLDSNGIWNLIPNPRLEDYPVGSRARLLATDFSSSYLNLLAQLNTAFLGYPELIAATFGTMNSLAIKAGEITQLPITAGGREGHAGPTFLNPLLLPPS